MLEMFLWDLGPSHDGRLPSCLWALALFGGFSSCLGDGVFLPFVRPTHLGVRWNKIVRGPWHVAM